MIVDVIAFSVHTSRSRSRYIAQVLILLYALGPKSDAERPLKMKM